MSCARPIRLGVLGLGRGRSFMGGAVGFDLKLLGFDLVALCDQWEARIKAFAGEFPTVSVYTDFDRFLEHDMDAVVLANAFHQHAPFAVKAMRAGFDVMSETQACHTLAEGVDLIRTVEKTGRIYMFAENFAYMRHNQELRRVFQTGEFGPFMYGEAEYVHPGSVEAGTRLSPGLDHWRNWIPATYYCTHAMAPIMYITDTWPVQVNGFVVRRPPSPPAAPRSVSRHDAASMIAVRMDNHAVVKLLQGGLRGGLREFTRIHAARGYLHGQIAGGPLTANRVTLIREQFGEELKHPAEIIYIPNFPVMHKEAMAAGHGGGDFFVMHHFAEAIRSRKQPYLDVTRGVAMSIVGIQAYRSALNNSNSEPVPDFRLESERARYETDNWSPDPARRAPGQPWPSVEGNKIVPPRAVRYARTQWKRMGYTGR